MSPGSTAGASSAPASAVTTHVLDTARGHPAAGVAVRLEFVSRDGQPGDGGPGEGYPDDGAPGHGGPDDGRPAGRAAELGRSMTDGDGRARDLGPATLPPGVYRLVFDTGAYFAGQGSEPAFFPEVSVTFRVDGQSRHHHVPLLLSPFAYSTYRGS